MEKSKPTVHLEPESPRRNNVVLPAILISIGVILLLVNTGIFSFNDIGDIFGSIGRIFGEVGSTVGRIFGDLGGSIGGFFGNLGGSIGRFWPLLLIAIGAVLLFRRGGASKAKNTLYEDR